MVGPASSSSFRLPAARAQDARRALAWCLLATLAAAAGCNIIGPAAYYLRPPQIQKPEFKLTDGRVAVLIDSARGVPENPVFNESLYSKVVEISRVKKRKTTFVPLREIVGLRHANSDFAHWSVQRIGRELNAEQVLYIKIARLDVSEGADLPVAEPVVEVHTSVIGVNTTPDLARLWPREKAGRPEKAERQAQTIGGPGDVDIVLRKLAYDLAWRLTVPFFDTDLETPLPVER